MFLVWATQFLENSLSMFSVPFWMLSSHRSAETCTPKTTGPSSQGVRVSRCVSSVPLGQPLSSSQLPANHDRISTEHKSWKTSMVRLVIINALNCLVKWMARPYSGSNKKLGILKHEAAGAGRMDGSEYKVLAIQAWGPEYTSPASTYKTVRYVGCWNPSIQLGETED